MEEYCTAIANFYVYFVHFIHRTNALVGIWQNKQFCFYSSFIQKPSRYEYMLLASCLGRLQHLLGLRVRNSSFQHVINLRKIIFFSSQCHCSQITSKVSNGFLDKKRINCKNREPINKVPSLSIHSKPQVTFGSSFITTENLGIPELTEKNGDIFTATIW